MQEVHFALCTYSERLEDTFGQHKQNRGGGEIKPFSLLMIKADFLLSLTLSSVLDQPPLKIDP